ncbi:MAG: ATP-binding protein [Desulfovibrionaceae bacterium]|nr:ATP-binding protein [Desulfovibrionaceae bacterium]
MRFKSAQRRNRLQTDAVQRDVLMSAYILAACSFIGFVFHSLNLSEANIISIYILGILLIASITSSWIYGAVSSVAGMILFNSLYADPIFNFYVYDWQYAITAGAMLIVSLVTNSIMTLFRGQLDREKLETRRLDILLETSQHLQQAQNVDDIFAVSLAQLYRMFERTVLFFPLSDGKVLQPMLRRSEDDLNFSPDHWGLDEKTLERFVHSDNEAENPLIHTHGGKKAVLFKVRNKKTVFAVVGIIVDSDENIVGFEYNLVLAMLDEVALSLEKHYLHVFNERIAREAEAERLRTNLLRTISHDLRTPLTSISGNADILLSNEEQINPDLRKQLYQNIYNDSEWLISLVENLLFITRIDNGVMSIHTEPEILQEVIPEALHCLARRAEEHTIVLELPEDFFVVKMDARLIMQVIINIVDNAIKYAPLGSDIKVRAFQRDLQVVVEIADTGCGISDEDKQKVFEMFYTTNKKSGDSRRGIGLGLPLCQSIVHAHGGTIHIADNVPSGVIMSFALHLEEVRVENEYPGS